MAKKTVTARHILKSISNQRYRVGNTNTPSSYVEVVKRRTKGNRLMLHLENGQIVVVTVDIE